jgi:hypothetical protein
MFTRSYQQQNNKKRFMKTLEIHFVEESLPKYISLGPAKPVHP